MKVIPCEAEHIRSIELQPRQAFVTGLARSAGKAEEIIAAGPAFTALFDDHVIACMGILKEGERARDLCWTMLSKDAGQCLISITRAANRFMSTWPNPLYAYSEANWPETVRWHKLLGFKIVGALFDARKWLPDGQEHSASYTIWVREPR